MNSRMRLENTIVNLDQITRVEFTPAYPGGEPKEENPEQLTASRPAVLELTLTSVHLDVKEYDFSEFTAAGASESDVVRVTGELAERAWHLLASTASYGVLAQPEAV